MEEEARKQKATAQMLAEGLAEEQQQVASIIPVMMRTLTLHLDVWDDPL